MTKRCRPGLELNLQDPDCVEFINTLYSIFGEYKFRLLSKLHTNDYFTQTNIEQIVHTPSQLKLLAYSIQHLSKETVAEWCIVFASFSWSNTYMKTIDTNEFSLAVEIFKRISCVQTLSFIFRVLLQNYHYQLNIQAFIQLFHYDEMYRNYPTMLDRLYVFSSLLSTEQKQQVGFCGENIRCIERIHLYPFWHQYRLYQICTQQLGLSSPKWQSYIDTLKSLPIEGCNNNNTNNNNDANYLPSLQMLRWLILQRCIPSTEVPNVMLQLSSFLNIHKYSDVVILWTTLVYQAIFQAYPSTTIDFSVKNEQERTIVECIIFQLISFERFELRTQIQHSFLYNLCLLHYFIPCLIEQNKLRVFRTISFTQISIHELTLLIQYTICSFLLDSHQGISAYYARIVIDTLSFYIVLLPTCMSLRTLQLSCRSRLMDYSIKCFSDIQRLQHVLIMDLIVVILGVFDTLVKKHMLQKPRLYVYLYPTIVQMYRLIQPHQQGQLHAWINGSFYRCMYEAVYKNITNITNTMFSQLSLLEQKHIFPHLF